MEGIVSIENFSQFIEVTSEFQNIGLPMVCVLTDDGVSSETGQFILNFQHFYFQQEKFMVYSLQF